jgi:hypothetical protein
VTATSQIPGQTRDLFSSLALVGLALGMVQPALLMDRAPRQVRAGTVRAGGGGSQRIDASGIEGEVPEFARPPRGLRTGEFAAAAIGRGAGAGAAAITVPVGREPRRRVEVLSPAILTIALRARPQAPTFGRPPPA